MRASIALTVRRSSTTLTCTRGLGTETPVAGTQMSANNAALDSGE